MEIVLVRHAQPRWSANGRAQVDPGLTELGARQAALVAERLSSWSFDRILVSTATRSQETAAPIRAALRHVPTEDRDWLHEIRSPSTWQGTPAEEVGRVLEEARERPRDAWWDGLPDGESFIDFHERVTAGLQMELQEVGVERTDDRLWRVPATAPDRLLMVAHAGTNSVVLGFLLGLQPEPWEWERFASNHASVTVLRTTPIAGHHIFSLQSFSDVSHLEPDELTA